MKRISLITVFDNPNFGTYLQALALSLFLERYNTKVEIVHYERPIWHTYSSLRKKTKWFEPLRILKAYIKGQKSVIQRYQCRRFVGKHIAITKPYYSFEELEANPPIADIYLTGSDQVWNTIHNHGLDRSFYLGFAPKDKPKYAYAASIGMDSIPEEYKCETKSLLEQYKAISVREQSNVNMLKDIGIDSQMVLDPTLLFSAEEWMEYAKKMTFDEPYVLVYSVESKKRDNIVGEVARKVANLLNCKIYEVNYFGENKTIAGCDRHFYYATPDVFLSLVAHASYIVGSSFHVTAFAINFNKPFITVAPDRFSSRIDGLLEMTGLQSRKIVSIESFNKELVDTNLNYSQSNLLLGVEREKSIAFIKKIVK